MACKGSGVQVPSPPPKGIRGFVNIMMTALGRKASLSDRELALLASEMPNRQKSLAVAFLLWFFLGTLGVYHFYLGNARRAWIMIALTVIGFVTIIVLVGIILLLIAAVMWIIDAVRMSALVSQQNATIETQLINEIVGGRSAAAV